MARPGRQGQVEATHVSRSVPLILAAMLLLAGLAALPPATAAPTVQHVTIASFDGTPLAATVFLPEGASGDDPVPFVLMTHGWAGSRQTTATGRVGDLLDAGYGVLTWDSRGFGASGGEVELNSPDFEGKDVSALLTWLAGQPYAQLDAEGDPRVGMSGGSYAGGIQLLAAAFDARIDVIAPEITWNDLAQSLGPDGVPKLYWTSLLLGAGAEASCVNARNGDPQGALAAAAASESTGCQTSDLARYYAMVHATNSVPDEVRDALLARSPATYMDQIDIPTLLVQGFPDTLFDVDQAAANYEGIKANGAPVKLWLYDGGHSHPEAAGLVPNTQGGEISATVVNWFDRHLKQDADVDTGAEVQYFADGAWHSAASWPVAGATQHAKHVNGLPPLAQGPFVPGGQGKFSIRLAAGDQLAVGPASVAFTASGVGASEATVFFALEVVGPAGAVRVDQQVQPARFPLSTTGARVEVDLVDVAAALGPDDALWLTVTTSERDFGSARVPATVNLHDLDIAWETI
jgi:ABC-2 type transport system ATP-binding protein